MSRWNDDDRDVKYSLKYETDDVLFYCKESNIFKEINGELEESKWSFYNDCEYIDYAYERPEDDYNIEENFDEVKECSEDREEKDEGLDPSFDPLQPSKFMYI